MQTRTRPQPVRSCLAQGVGARLWPRAAAPRAAWRNQGGQRGFVVLARQSGARKGKDTSAAIPPPSMRGRVPILGNSLEVMKLDGTGDTKDGATEYFLKCRDTLGNVVGLHLGDGKETYLINDPHLVEEITKKAHVYSDRSAAAGVMLPFTSEADGFSEERDGKCPVSGMIFSNGDKHKKFRNFGLKSISGPAKRDILERIVREKAAKLRDRWLAVGVGGMEAVRVDREMQRFTVEVIGEAAFSHDFGLLDAEHAIQTEPDRFSKEVTALMKTQLKVVWNDPLRLWRWFETKEKRQINQHMSYLVDFENDFIEHRRKLQDQGVVHSDFLGALLADTDENGNHLSNRDIRWCVHDMLIGGNDTTYKLISATLALLAVHQDLQTALREEVVSVMRGGIPTTADVSSSLPLLTAVVSETLRLYPPTNFTSRQCVGGPDVLGDAYLIPKNSAVCFSPYVMHRSDHWTNPDTYDPGRFLPGGEWEGVGGSVPRMAWIPFGAGHRICIGAHLALTESHVLLGTLIQNFKFDLVAAGFGPSGVNADGSLNVEYGVAIDFPEGISLQVSQLDEIEQL